MGIDRRGASVEPRSVGRTGGGFSSCSFPIDIGEPDLTPEALEELHDQAALSQTGGMYPVGSNGLWHGGVHLSLREGVPVRAPAGGRLVAARLDPDEERATCAYGHTNFILTKHTWPPSASAGEGTPYYMLFMHLTPEPLEGAAPEVPWLEVTLRKTTTDGLALRAEPNTDEDTEVKTRLQEGQLLTPHGEPTAGTEYEWQEVTVRESGREGHVATAYTTSAEPPIGDGALDNLRNGTVANLDVPVEAGELLWWGGLFGQNFEDWGASSFEWEEHFAEEFRKMNYPDPIERGPAVHWEVFSLQKAFGLEQDDGQGGSQGSEGEQSEGGTSGNAQADSGSAGAEEKPRFAVPSWTTKIDSGSALTFNPKESEALDFIKKKRAGAADLPDNEDYTALSLGEKQTIHLLEEGKELRTVAVKYASEWGLDTGGLGKALKSSPVHDKKADKGDFEDLQFWSKVDALPSETKVWHYHPVTALEALAVKHPWFYMRDGDDKQPVSTNDEVWAQAEGEGESVYVQDINKTWKLGDTGERSGNQGIGQDPEDSPNLYEMLREGEGGDSIPRNMLSDLQQRVWSSLSYIEGSLAAINTYDSAYLSVGPLQKTAGADFGDTTARGELFGVIDFLLNPSNYDGGDDFLSESERQTFREAFQRHFGNRLSFAQSAEITGVPKAHPEVDGTVLSAPDQKERFRNNLKWPYRFLKAYKDPEFRKPVLRKGLGRLDTVMSQNLRFTVTVEGREHLLEPELRDVFSRDLSQALLLGWHINYPDPVWEPDGKGWFASPPPPTLPGSDEIPDRVTHVIEKLREWRITAVDDLPLTRDQELRLVVLLLRARMDSEMTDPAGRAGKILRYTSPNVIEDLLSEAGYTRGPNERRESFIERGLEAELVDEELRPQYGPRATGGSGWNGGSTPESGDPIPNVLNDFEGGSNSE